MLPIIDLDEEYRINICPRYAMFLPLLASFALRRFGVDDTFLD